MPRTLRELVWAWQGEQYAAWERTAALMAMIANVNRDPKKKSTPYTPQDFFKRPGAKSLPRGVPLTGDAFRSMKSAFITKRT